MIEVPKDVAKNLCNASYEKRKAAALTLENMTRRALQNGKEEVST